VTSHGDRSSALPADHRQIEPAMKRVTDLLSRDGAYDPITHAAWDAADSAAVKRLMDTMRSSTKDMLGVARRQNLRDAIGDPGSDLVLSELSFQGKTIRTWQAVERSSIPSFVESSRSFADGARRIIRQLPFDSPEAHQAARRLAVEELLRSWGYGAGQMLPQRLAMQMAARDEFGPTGILDLNTYGDRNRNKTARRDHARNEGVLRDFLRQQYEETQRELARRGIEEVVLYRGIAFDPRHPVPSLAEAANGDVVPAPASLPLQSWTTMPGVAKRYTGLGEGAVMAGVFPASQVLSTPWTGLGQLPLNEFVLLATPGEVTVLRPPHVSGISDPDLAAGWELPKPGEGWTTCEQGHRHFGTEGGAGVLSYNRGPGGDVRVLMQLRSVETHHGGTWGLPGGARHHRGEDPIEAGLREAGEENRLDPREVTVRGVHHDDHGGWAYDTVIGEMSHLADVWPASRESLDNAWVPLEEVPGLNLHPDLARAWPEVRAELDRILANPTEPTRTAGSPAPGPPAPAIPGGFSPIADPRPRNFAEAAAIVHRWTPGTGDTGDTNRARPGRPHQDGPANRIERLLSGSPEERAGADPAAPAVPDEELLAAGRRLAEHLPVVDDDGETTARALGSMSRIVGGPDPRRAIVHLAAEPGLDLDIQSLVTLFGDARRYGRSPETATDRAALVDILRSSMEADSHRWTGYRNRALFTLRDTTATQARTIGLMMRMMDAPLTQSTVRNFVQPVLRSHGIRDIRQLLPVVRAAHNNGYFPYGTTGEKAFHAAMDLFRQEDRYLWNGVLLAEKLSLTDLDEAPTRLLALLNEIGGRPGGTVHPLERLADAAGQGGSVRQLIRLAHDAQAHGTDLTRAADARELTGLLTAHRTRDPHLWDGLRIATERGITLPSDDEARALSRLAEITGSEPSSRWWVFDPLRRLAGEAGLDHSVERLARRAAEVQRDGFDLFGPVDRRQVLDVLTRSAPRRLPDTRELPPGPHDLSPSTVRHARQVAIREHAEAQQASRQGRPALRRVRSLVAGPDPLVVAEQQRVASLEARVQAWHRRPEAPEVSFTRDHAAFLSAYDRAVERAARGEEVIPYLLDNATASLAARDGGRGFGLEVEFDLPGLTPDDARQAIARDLHEAGLTGDARVHRYHSMRGEGYRSGRNGGRGLWKLELDGSVAGELVSPILFDEPETWVNLRLACEIIRSHGGTASASTGGHIHLGTYDYDHIVGNYTGVLDYIGHYPDTLFRLGHNPERESHRGLKYCRPNELPAEGYESIASVRHLNSDRRFAMNVAGMTGSAKDHIELRFWDGSLVPAVIQSQVKVALGMVEAGPRNATLGLVPHMGRRDPLGAHAGLLGLDPALDRTEQGSLSFRCLMDEIFWRAADKEQLTALYAATRWVRGA
jgi:8-oxo-dGTP pyrophosphatase MutT (NUDIX family)